MAYIYIYIHIPFLMNERDFIIKFPTIHDIFYFGIEIKTRLLEGRYSLGKVFDS